MDSGASDTPPARPCPRRVASLRLASGSPDLPRRCPTADHLAPERLLVVSNRLPLTIRRSGGTWEASPSSGGLVAALGPLAGRLEAHWIGWSGDSGALDDADRRRLLDRWERERGFVAVDLPRAVAEGFYEGYSNATLWPVLHGFPGRVEFDRRTWNAYREANERFADVVVERAGPRDLIWIHDYQLALLPGLIRERLPEAAIGFFLHVPFPGAELFRILPERDALLRGLLGADLVAFQTHAHMHDFRRALLEVLALASRMDRVDVDGRSVALAAIPIGIVVEHWERLLARPEIVARVHRRRASAGGVRRILAVDRLDETKGIPERLRAFRELLRRRRGWIGRVQLVQVAVPSRERVPRYAELRRAVSELVGEINGELATPDWTPIVYLRRSIDESELAALYATADVGWVAPLRDGMNLVAKEFVVCQGEATTAGGGPAEGAAPGVLVLSEFAGAARELGEALLVNPYDLERSVDAVERALAMPDDERRARQAALLRRIRRHDALTWATRFLDGLGAAARERSGERRLGPPSARQLATAVADADERTFYLDYDGTLVPIAPRPSEAIPTAAGLEVVERLSSDPRNHVVVLSGRPRSELDGWFGRLDRLWLAAEHGALLREPGSGEWRPLHAGADTRWKDRVRPTLDQFADRAPGSFVEEKDYGLAWHYRLADPEFGRSLAAELLALLDRQLSGTDLVVASGRKVVEVRFGWANKGDAGLAIRASLPRAGFELAIGDDRTDEDLFERLPASAWTIHVGRGPSRARYGVQGPEEVVDLLERLAAVRPAARDVTRPVRPSPRRQGSNGKHGPTGTSAAIPALASRRAR